MNSALVSSDDKYRLPSEMTNVLEEKAYNGSWTTEGILVTNLVQSIFYD